MNTAALRVSDIDASTADPAGGQLVRGANGSPTGILTIDGYAPPTLSIGMFLLHVLHSSRLKWRLVEGRNPPNIPELQILHHGRES